MASEHNLEQPAEATILPSAVIQILGDQPDSQRVCPKIHAYLSSKWNQWTTEGIHPEIKADILTKYPLDAHENLNPPTLNAEIASSVPEATLKRDHHFVDTQNLIATAMKALGSALTPLLDTTPATVNSRTLLPPLSDIGKLLCELQFNQSAARKSFISPMLNKDLSTVFKESKIDKFLYGQNLGEKIRECKTIDKAGQELCKKVPQPKNTRTSLNWKRPPTQQSSRGGYRQRPQSSAYQYRRPARRQYNNQRFNTFNQRK